MSSFAYSTYELVSSLNLHWFYINILIMNRKQAVRIQTSMLNEVEKKALIWLANRQPAWMTSDFMTFVGFLGALLISVGYILYDFNYNFLWLSTFGLIVNWYGDSLDGTIARVRNKQRPLYGYYLDHSMDVVNEFIMFFGVGISSLLNMNIALLLFVVYMALSLNVSMNVHLRGEFKLTYAKLGPTEFRLIIITVNTLFAFIRPLRDYSCELMLLKQNFQFGIFDFAGMGILLLLLTIYVVTIIRDTMYYNKIDPKKDE
jgi:archaetidylinositol phosphate synthase